MQLTKDGNLDTKPSSLDMYAKRTSFESDFPKICNFATIFCQTKSGFKKRTSLIVIETYPNNSSNPNSPNYHLFCKYQLVTAE